MARGKDGDLASAVATGGSALGCVLGMLPFLLFLRASIGRIASAYTKHRPTAPPRPATTYTPMPPASVPLITSFGGAAFGVAGGGIGGGGGGVKGGGKGGGGATTMGAITLARVLTLGVTDVTGTPRLADIAATGKLTKAVARACTAATVAAGAATGTPFVGEAEAWGIVSTVSTVTLPACKRTVV